MCIMKLTVTEQRQGDNNYEGGDPARCQPPAPRDDTIAADIASIFLVLPRRACDGVQAEVASVGLCATVVLSL